MYSIHRSLLSTGCTHIALWSVLFVSIFHSVPALATSNLPTVQQTGSAIISCLQHTKSVDRCNKEITQHVALIARANNASPLLADAGVITVPTTGALVATGIVVTVVLSVWFACGVNQLCQSSTIKAQLQDKLSILDDPALKQNAQRRLEKIIQDILSTLSTLKAGWQHAQNILQQLNTEIKKYHKELATVERSIRPKASRSNGGNPNKHRPPAAPYKGIAGNALTAICEQLLQEMNDLNALLLALIEALQSIVNLQQKQYNLATGKEDTLREILAQFEEKLGRLYNEFSKDPTVSNAIQNAINRIWEGKKLRPPKAFKDFLTENGFATRNIPYSNALVEDKLAFLNLIFEKIFTSQSLVTNVTKSEQYLSYRKEVTRISEQSNYFLKVRRAPNKDGIAKKMNTKIIENQRLILEMNWIKDALKELSKTVENGMCTSQQFMDIESQLIKLLSEFKKIKEQISALTKYNKSNPFHVAPFTQLVGETNQKIRILQEKLQKIRNGFHRKRK
jgi:peptidoglycan hydrolase CwlO-like protein